MSPPPTGKAGPEKKSSRRAIIAAAATHYADLSWAERRRLVDELMRLSGYHRKHILRLLRQARPLASQAGEDSTEIKSGGPGEQASVSVAFPRRQRPSRVIYGPHVVDALVPLWEASDRLCGKRLHALLPLLIESLERHGHLVLEPEVRALLLQASAATLDRLLKPIREQASGGTRRRPPRAISAVRKRIPVRTFNDWPSVAPGWFEMDLVAHCGDRLAGCFLWTLVLTDIASGWTECIPLLARDGALVRTALDEVEKQLPIPLRGLDCDNDSVFMNEGLEQWCQQRSIELTRSRAYTSNDQAWVEQKNGALVRRVVGYERLEGFPQLEQLCTLYAALRLFANFYQPSFKLKERKREGAKVRRQHHRPRTPCQRLLSWSDLPQASRLQLERSLSELDPLQLLESIRQAQSQLVTGGAITQAPASPEPQRQPSLEQFLESLRLLWEQSQGEPRASRKQGLRNYRTRPDPFADSWDQVLSWLAVEPALSAREILDRLMAQWPERYQSSHLRTLQRRVKQWRLEQAGTVLATSLEWNPLDQNVN